MLRAKDSENMSFREPFREGFASAELPRAQENLVFGPRCDEFLCCALIIDLPFKKKRCSYDETDQYETTRGKGIRETTPAKKQRHMRLVLKGCVRRTCY